MFTPIKTIRTRVKNSAEQLDKDIPGWAKQIDKTTLDLNCFKDCVAAQLKLDGPKCNPERGFSLNLDEGICTDDTQYPNSDYQAEENPAYQCLTNLWLEVINQRIS